MQKLGMSTLPTIVVEGKVSTPTYSQAVTEPTFLVRADTVTDNPLVAASVFRRLSS